MGTAGGESAGILRYLEAPDTELAGTVCILADEETGALANNHKFLTILERSQARHKANGGIALEKMNCIFGLDE